MLGIASERAIILLIESYTLVRYFQGNKITV
jgi:hypothetical protein